MIKTIQIDWTFAAQRRVGRIIERLPLECLVMWTFVATASFLIAS